MKCCLLVLALVCAGSPSPLHDDDLTSEWSAFKARHNTMFSSVEEEARRLENFALNRRMILEHNRLYDQGLVSFRMKINHFADQSRAERRRNSTLARPAHDDAGTRFVSPRMQVPAAVDWRHHGYVTEVKNQGKCGACWSFSATGALEGQHFRRSGRLVSLSEQNLIDCSGGDYGNEGCDGGDMGHAYTYIINNHGIDSEQDYPFEKKKGRCRYAAGKAAATVEDFVVLTEGDEAQLRQAVGSVGPVSIGIDASPASFDFYDQGVYYDESCSSRDLDHAVLVVGYGKQDGREFWLLKNSWGEEWGEVGYMRLARDTANHCGVATYASYPLV